jgi:FixJ family two-component response regulator
MMTIGRSSPLPICLSDIDGLISDIGRPDMNGIELRGLALSERTDLPVFLITGRPEVRAQCASTIERDRDFEKPFDSQRLRAAIRSALRPRRPEPAEK